MPENGRVLDSSVVIAVIRNERGAEKALELLKGGRITSVNAGEVVGILRRKGMPHHEAERVFLRLGLRIEPFTAEDGLVLGALSTREAQQLGLGLGDRACLAAAKVRGLVAVTADREWRKFDSGVRLEVIR